MHGALLCVVFVAGLAPVAHALCSLSEVSNCTSESSYTSCVTNAGTSTSQQCDCWPLLSACYARSDCSSAFETACKGALSLLSCTDAQKEKCSSAFHSKYVSLPAALTLVLLAIMLL
eukprot:TRINITY_DN398_c0_g1_i1.p1 TRINITY_DN398_c0_g1~~TRINITY_DN398_c0_g1_i1.p1  ORF type:complete len:132 (+),score=28.10 TRINITY_DN398_c0_g1_i1:47-397(+)